jgi:antitoxin HigA-1
MPMKNPPRPGHSIKDACLDPPGLSVTEAAKVLDIARHTLSRVLNGHAGISPDMAVRLEKAG